MRRFVAALLAVLLSCLLTAVPAAATPVHTAAATATATNAGVEYGGAGYNLVAPWMKGSPYAQHIWLNPHTYGAGHLALLLPALGRELKSWGFAISYVGYSVAEPAVNGRITVSSRRYLLCSSPLLFGLHHSVLQPLCQWRRIHGPRRREDMHSRFRLRLGHLTDSLVSRDWARDGARTLQLPLRRLLPNYECVYQFGHQLQERGP